MPENEIVRCAIHPAIGIARVGNAPADEYYLAPEIPGQAADPGTQGYKNDKGEIRREAARFRVYGYDAAGKVVKEITADDAEIVWEVHVANRKAAWYKFLNALDLKQFAMTPDFRNADIPGARRQDLVIDPGPRRISGKDQSGPEYAFDQGWISFQIGSIIEVPLGEVRTDEKGRLIVIGGAGHSASATGAQAVTFANNDGWYDDTSDGPVRATVKLKGGKKTLEAEPAMVAVTPPNYGQGLHGPVTLYDVVYDLFLRHGWVKKKGKIRFWQDIYPILARLVGNQWVSQGAYFLFGAGSPSDFSDPDYLARLASPDRKHKPAREAVFRWFRQPPPPWDSPTPRADLPPDEPAGLPPFYGDGVDYAGLTIYDLAVTPTMYEWLRLWADGDFEPGDRGDRPEKDARLEKLKPEDQVAALDKAPLEDCLGGPFHPGIELTWPMRVPSMWKVPSQPGPRLQPRLNVLPPNVETRDDYGPFLTPEICLGPGGPLEASGPGSLTRWLGIPWQTDEASCLSGYNTSNYLPLPSFWAARVPNQVLALQSYDRLQDTDLPEPQKMKHFTYRQFWLRDLNASGAYQARINNMVANWHAIGIVAELPAPAGGTGRGWPERYWVETGRAEKYAEPDPTFEQVKRAERPADAEKDKEALFKTTAEALPARTAEEKAAHPRPRRQVVRRDR